MGKILCATRGGEASIKTQEAAIDLARETGDELVFFYAYDVEFLAHARYTLRSDVVEDELDDMGEFLMTMAVERAQEQGVPARYIIRQGEFVPELAATAHEEKATLVVIGQPGEADSQFELEHLRQIAEELKATTGIPVRILPEQ